jgi:hypothetical protein
MKSYLEARPMLTMSLAASFALGAFLIYRVA